MNYSKYDSQSVMSSKYGEYNKFVRASVAPSHRGPQRKGGTTTLWCRCGIGGGQRVPRIVSDQEGRFAQQQGRPRSSTTTTTARRTAAVAFSAAQGLEPRYQLFEPIVNLSHGGSFAGCFGPGTLQQTLHSRRPIPLERWTQPLLRHQRAVFGLAHGFVGFFQGHHFPND